jgi:Na+/H+ antiporter NhaD/arsenite permease-like protein
LKLLYWRQKRYYIEHIIFLLHTHSVFFLIVPVFYVLNFTLHIKWAWISLLLIFYVFAMKKYYNQRKTKTILKFAAFSFFYFMITFFVLMGTLALSAMIF